MELTLVLDLPQDKLSVPVVRRICADAMSALGVARGCVQDVELALSEACTNVLDHSDDSTGYCIRLRVDDQACTIEVIDDGRGFDADAVGLSEADPNAEEGRGIQLIRALVDRVQFTNRANSGTVVHLEKSLEWRPDSPAGRLSELSEP